MKKEYNYRKKCIQRLRYYYNRFQGVELLDTNFRAIFHPLGQKKEIKSPNPCNILDLKSQYEYYKKVIDECDEKEIIELHWRIDNYMLRKRLKW